MLNKKASEKIMSVIYLMYLIIIGVGVVIIVAQYINSPVEIGPLESNVLYTNLMDCLTKNGFVSDAVFKDDFNVYSYCHMSESILNPSKKIGDVSRDYFWFNITFLGDKDVVVRNSLVGGNSIYQKDCEVNVGKNSKYFPFCIFKNESYIFVNKSGMPQNVRLVILVASFNEGVREATI